MYPNIEDQIKVIASVKKKINEDQNGTLIYLTISGSHLYGFPSVNSDVDYRGAYLTGEENLLGLHGKRDVIELIKPRRAYPDESPDPADVVVFEMKKELGLALKSNCNVLEHINATPIYRTAEYLDMKRLVNNALGKRGIYNSYRGMAMFNYKKFIMRDRRTYKKYLYIFRGLMAGIHVLETGRIQPNLIELNKYFRIKHLDVLIEHKREETEKEVVKAEIDSGLIDEEIVKLFERLDRAYERSKIPDKPDLEDVEAVHRWLVSLRKDRIRR